MAARLHWFVIGCFMGWDLVGELRQLSHDMVNTSPQADAIKAKHPAILDAAAREIVSLRDIVEEQRALLQAVKSSDRRDACVASR